MYISPVFQTDFTEYAFPTKHKNMSRSLQAGWPQGCIIRSSICVSLNNVSLTTDHRAQVSDFRLRTAHLTPHCWHLTPHLSHWSHLTPRFCSAAVHFSLRRFTWINQSHFQGLNSFLLCRPPSIFQRRSLLARASIVSQCLNSLVNVSRHFRML